MNLPDMTLDIPSEDLSIANPIALPEVTQQLSENIILTTVDDIYNWAKMSSLYPLMFGTACCFIEFSALLASRFDLDRWGVFPRMSPRQADLIITAGTITMKYAPVLVRIYEQMPEPKYVIAMGACTITGGMFRRAKKGTNPSLLQPPSPDENRLTSPRWKISRDFSKTSSTKRNCIFWIANNPTVEINCFYLIKR
jgi:NADH-quinone oxidoreductase B subunit